MIIDIAITSFRQTKKIEGMGQPFSEIKLHLAAYSCRRHQHDDTCAILLFNGVCLARVSPQSSQAIVSIGDIVLWFLLQCQALESMNIC